MLTKTRDIHIKITDEKYALIKQLAEREYRKVTAIVDRALDNYLIAKKIIKES